MSRNFQIVSPSGDVLDFHIEGTTVHRRILSSQREQILRQNAELRKNRGALKHLTFMGLDMEIPNCDIPMIEKYWPGAMDASHPDHKWQLRRFRESPASAPYRVHATPRGKANAAYIKT